MNMPPHQQAIRRDILPIPGVAHVGRTSGKINWVQIDLGDDAKDADHYIDPDERFRIALARQ